MGLVTKINSTYIEVNRNVKILEQEGVLSERRYGRIRMIILNAENPKTELLIQALKILNSQTKPTNNAKRSPINPKEGDKPLKRYHRRGNLE